MKRTLAIAVALAALASPAVAQADQPARTPIHVTRNGLFWNEIASYYAQRPMTVTFTTETSSARTVAYSGRAELGIVARDKLRWITRFARDPKRGPQGGVLGIMSLIHEAIHNRDFGTASPLDPLSRNPVTGFYSATNERQAGILGCQLIPDAMERFFGIPQGSALGKRYADLAAACVQPWLLREEG